MAQFCHFSYIIPWIDTQMAPSFHYFFFIINYISMISFFFFFLHKCLSTSQIISLGKISGSGLQELKCWTFYGGRYALPDSCPGVPRCRWCALCSCHWSFSGVVYSSLPLPTWQGTPRNYFSLDSCNFFGYKWAFNIFHISYVFKSLFLWLFVFDFSPFICETLDIPLTNVTLRKLVKTL